MSRTRLARIVAHLIDAARRPLHDSGTPTRTRCAHGSREHELCVPCLHAASREGQ